MKKKQSLIGFTLIEILVVSTIIGLLMAGGIASYSQFGKQSRDARRKADLEQIRAALEMYRSNSVQSSYPTSLSALVPDYIKSEPVDPKTQINYTYTALPAGCDGSATPCTDYLLETTLETGGVYQTNPYGGSVIEPTNPVTIIPSSTPAATNTPPPAATNTPAPPTPTPQDCIYYCCDSTCSFPMPGICAGGLQCCVDPGSCSPSPTPTPQDCTWYCCGGTCSYPMPGICAGGLQCCVDPQSCFP